MKGTRNTDRNSRKYITITDTSLWEQIEQIMTLPTYAKSFNRVINDALVYGLPKLYAAEFQAEEPSSGVTERDVIGDEFLKIVRLLKEVIINENINKSLICSLFRLKEKEIGETAIGKQFSKGYYQDTPDFISDYEIRELRKIRD